MVNHCWDKQDWEDELCFNVFRRWLLMFDDRDIHEAFRLETGKTYNHNGEKVVAPMHIIRACNGHIEGSVTWEERARQWDMEQERKDVSWWLEQRKRLRKNEYEIASLLLKKAREMIDWPIYTEEEEDTEEGVTIIRKPVKWAMRDVTNMLKVGSEISRLAAEMETSIHKFVIALSPEAMRAVEILEQQGISYTDVADNYERVLIAEAKKYELTAKSN